MKPLFAPGELVPSSEPRLPATVHVAARRAFARRRCAVQSYLRWGMRCLPRAQAEGRLALGGFKRLAAGVSAPVISCLPRQGAAETVGMCWCVGSRAGARMGERKGKRLEIRVVLVLGNVQSRKIHDRLLGGGQGSTVLKRNAFAP